MSDLLGELLEDSDRTSALYLKAHWCAALYAAAVNAASALGVPLSWIRVEYWGRARRVSYNYQSSVLLYDGATWKHQTLTRTYYTSDDAACFLLYPEEEVSEVPAEAQKVKEEPYYQLRIAELVYRDVFRGKRVPPYVKVLYPPETPKRKGKKSRVGGAS